MTLKIPVRLGRSKPVRRENDIQREVLEALRKMGKFALRLNSGKVKVRGGWMSLCAEGTPDILLLECGLLRPNVTWIEMKAERGRQSDRQKEFEIGCIGRGERYLLARSLDDVLKILK